MNRSSTLAETKHSRVGLRPKQSSLCRAGDSRPRPDPSAKPQQRTCPPFPSVDFQSYQRPREPGGKALGIVMCLGTHHCSQPSVNKPRPPSLSWAFSCFLLHTATRPGMAKSQESCQHQRQIKTSRKTGTQRKLRQCHEGKVCKKVFNYSMNVLAELNKYMYL